MVLTKKKKDKISKYLDEGKTWKYINNKTGASNDTINRIRKASLSSTNPQLDKTQRVYQDLSTKKQQPTTPNNTPDSVLRLEKKIDNFGKTLLTNNKLLQNVEETLNRLKPPQPPQKTTDPHQRKPDNEPIPPELPYQETKNNSYSTMTPTVQLPKMNSDQADAPPPDIKVNPPPSLDTDVQQRSKTTPIQIVSPPGNQENEDQAISSYRNALLCREAAKATPFIIKLVKDYLNYTKTGFFPYEDYIKYAKNTNNEKKIKKPMIGGKLMTWSSPCFRNPLKERMYRED